MTLPGRWRWSALCLLLALPLAAIAGPSDESVPVPPRAPDASLQDAHAPSRVDFITGQALAFPPDANVRDLVLVAAARNTGQIEALLELGAASGRPLVVDIGAQWCLPCRRGWSDFRKAAEGHPDIQFVAMSVDEAASGGGAVGRFVRAHWNGGMAFGMPSFAVLRADGTSCDSLLFATLDEAVAAAATCGTGKPEPLETALTTARVRVAAAVGDATIRLDASTLGEFLAALGSATGLTVLAPADIQNVPMSASSGPMPVALALQVVRPLGIHSDVVTADGSGERFLAVWFDSKEGKSEADQVPP